MERLKLRNSEWVLIAFFAYLAVISPWLRGRSHLAHQPLAILAVVIVLLCSLAMAQHSRVANAASIVRDWLPLGLTLTAFREMELFLPLHFDRRYETTWVRWDHVILSDWHIHRVIESFGETIPISLEFCYLLLYCTGAFCIAILYLVKRREAIDRFLVIFLSGTLIAYALFPYIPSQPPRVIFPEVDAPSFVSGIRRLNLWILKEATIHVGVFPSAHVSEAFSAAWGMFLVLPERKRFGWGLTVYATCVSVAAVYGRYHYAADVVAGFGVSLLAALIAVLLGKRAKNHGLASALADP